MLGLLFGASGCVDATIDDGTITCSGALEYVGGAVLCAATIEQAVLVMALQGFQLARPEYILRW